MITALLWLALNVYHESRGEPEIAQIAVAQVTLNRAKVSGDSVAAVVREKKQFSWTVKKLHKKPWKTDPKGFLQSGKIAVKAMAHRDVTGGATYFIESKLKRKPAWTKKMVVTARYGGLVFYRLRC
jgi:N-acetylmuramoyl-L-alanine amidase